MTKNIGTRDRIMRLIIGTVLVVIALVWVTAVWLQVALIIFAVFSLYEALASWCLLYQLLGRNTCPVQ